MSIRLKTDFRGSPPRPFRRENGIFYIRLRVGYRDIWRSCKTRVKREAEEYAYEIWFQHQKNDQKIMLQLPSSHLATELKSYQNTENYKTLKARTRHDRIRNAERFISYCKSKHVDNFEDLTPEFCESYLSSLGKTGKTFNTYRSDLLQVFAHTALRLSCENPFSKIPQRSTTRGETASKPKKAFTDEEITKILHYIKNSRKLQHADEWLKACRFAMYTGLRYEDIALLRYDSITDNVLELTPHKTETLVKKKILIKLPHELQKIFFRLNNLSDYIFPHLAADYPVYDTSGNRISGVSDPTKPFSKILKRLNITAPPGYSVGFHSFRVTLVTKLRQAGYSAEIIGGLVGHTNTLQTEHYNRAALAIDINKISYCEAK